MFNVRMSVGYCNVYIIINGRRLLYMKIHHVRDTEYITQRYACNIIMKRKINASKLNWEEAWYQQTHTHAVYKLDRWTFLCQVDSQFNWLKTSWAELKMKKRWKSSSTHWALIRRAFITLQCVTSIQWMMTLGPGTFLRIFPLFVC